MNNDKQCRTVEILSPAGSYECFRAALNAGADAVYAGGPRFGARAYADNFTAEQLVRSIGEAHLHGCRFYLTVNTLLKEDETAELYDYLEPLYTAGLDAVIVQDTGVFDFVRRCFPGMDIHASTQMTITGPYGARFLEEQGAKRVVPARELSIDEIRRIRKETDLEIECFVHGALCYCYSGQCLMSSMIGGRSGNRGQCAQPCRLPYTVNGEKKYFLSLKDICTLELIPEMIEAGIDSFKIEGRMKSPEYVAAVTAMYRKYTDLYLRFGGRGFKVDPKDREILMDLYNRGGSHTGYYKQHNGRGMLSLDRPNHGGVPAVKMTSQRGREIRGTALTGLNRGDVLETAGGKANYTLGNPVQEGQSLSFLVPRGVTFRKGTVFPRIRNEELIELIRNKYIRKDKQEKISGELELMKGKPAVLTVKCRDIIFTAKTESAVEEAKQRPLTADEAEKQIRKTGNSEFCFDSLEIRADKNIFLPVQQLKALRRSALLGLQEAVFEKNSRMSPSEERDLVYNVYYAEGDCQEKARKANIPDLAVLVSTGEQLEETEKYMAAHPEHRIRRIYPDCRMSGDFFHDEAIRTDLKELKRSGMEIMPALPHIFREPAERYLKAGADAFAEFPMDGFLIRNYETFQFLNELQFDKTVILDHNLYVFNRCAKNFWNRQGVTGFTAPLELNEAELGTLGIHESELIVYGYVPVMISAQCIRKTASGCNRCPGTTVMTDRYRKDFISEQCCAFCYNVIYNSEPLFLGMQREKIKSLSPAGLRMQFSTESGARTGKMLELMHAVLYSGERLNVPEFEYTQGHFKRGII